MIEKTLEPIVGTSLNSECIQIAGREIDKKEINPAISPALKSNYRGGNESIHPYQPA